MGTPAITIIRNLVLDLRPFSICFSDDKAVWQGFGSVGSMGLNLKAGFQAIFMKHFDSFQREVV